MNFKYDVSVIIPCFNARNTIAKTLGALLQQKTESTFEIIVVDSSNDGTDSIIRNQFPEVKLIHLDRQTLPGSGRNLGVQHAQGEIIMFTDADCVPDPDWISQIIVL